MLQANCACIQRIPCYNANIRLPTRRLRRKAMSKAKRTLLNVVLVCVLGVAVVAVGGELLYQLSKLM